MSRQCQFTQCFAINRTLDPPLSSWSPILWKFSSQWLAYFTILFCISLHPNLEDIRGLNVLRDEVCIHLLIKSLWFLGLHGKVKCDFNLQQCQCFLGFPGGSGVKNPPANAGDSVLSLGWEDTLEKEIATYSSILAMDRGAWRASVLGITRVRHNLVTEQHNNVTQKSNTTMWLL